MLHQEDFVKQVYANILFLNPSKQPPSLCKVFTVPCSLL